MLSNDHTFEAHGMAFYVTVERDEHMGAPWKESDGHGIVSDTKRHPFGMGTKPPKRGGERILFWENGAYQTYDIEATTKLAKKDGWGLTEAELKHLAVKLGHKPTRKEIVREAVERDFRYCRSWCNDEWHWVVVTVEAVDFYVCDSIGGIESNDDDYIDEVARDLADTIHNRLNPPAPPPPPWHRRVANVFLALE